MKKTILIIACMICAAVLTGCDTNYTETNISTYFDYCLIETSKTGERIFYDKNTRVMYYKDISRGGITPIYNADGTLKIYEEE